MSTTVKTQHQTGRMLLIPTQTPPGKHLVLFHDEEGILQYRFDPGERELGPFDKLVGSAGPGLTTDEFMALIRGDD